MKFGVNSVSMHDIEEVAHQENLTEDITRLTCDVEVEDATYEYVTKLLKAHD